MKTWFSAVAEIENAIFKIFTPHGSGTGFQIFCNNTMCGIATADHVIDHADDWEEPIKLLHHVSQERIVLKENKRIIFRYPDVDLAFILFQRKDLPISDACPVLISPERHLKRGVEAGWCGFPSVAPSELCFFAGHISCYLSGESSYLVDGVAINGVSGGPAIYIDKDDNVKIAGVVTAYLPNKTRNETLPGLCMIRSVDKYEEDLKRVRSIHEALEKQKKEQGAKVDEKRPSEPQIEKKKSSGKKKRKRSSKS